MCRSWLLRPVLSAAAVDDGVRTAARPRRGPGLRVSAAQGRTRRAIRGGGRDSRARLGRSMSITSARTRATSSITMSSGTRTSSSRSTIDTARIRGWEATLRSPRGERAQAHLAYSHQFVEGRGAVSGGLTSFDSAERRLLLPRPRSARHAHGWRRRGAPRHARGPPRRSNTGPGFSKATGRPTSRRTPIVSLQGSKAFGKQWTVIVTALNVGDTHFLLDESNTFGGTHFNSPRQVAAGVRYRFHY